MTLTLPLVGRRRELARIEQALDTPGVAAVVLAGEAGVGKTRLAKEAVATAEAKGCVARWAVATRSAASIPFGAMAHLMPTVEGGAEDRFALLQAAAEGMVQGTGGPRLALGVDDGHLLDDASAALLHQLASTARGFLVITVRSGVPAPDPVVALWKDGLAERLEVRALGRIEIDELVTTMLRGQVDGSTLRELRRLTHGNALFLRELILGGLDSGALARIGGVWRWEGPITAAPRLVELVETRLGRRDAQERDLLELLSLGEPLGAIAVARMVAAPALAAAERAGLLSVEKAGRRVEVRPAHPLYGEVARAQASALRVRSIHVRLADALEATGARRAGDLLRILAWRHMADVPSPPAQLIVGARQAMALFDYQLAERLAQAAVDAGGGLEAEYLVGETLLALGRVGEAELVLKGLAPRGTTDIERTKFAITRAFTLYWALNLPEQAKAVLRRAQQEVIEPGSADELTAVLAGFMLYGGNCTGALRQIAGLLDRPDVEDRSVVQALVVATPALFLHGRSDQAIVAAHRGLELARRLGGDSSAPWWQLQLSANLGNAYLAAGQLDEAEALAEQGYQRALGQPWPVEKALWAGWRGQVARARGQPRTALHWLREAAAAGRVDVPLPFMPTILGELAHSAALLADLPAAEAALLEAESFTGESARVFQLWAALARPWVAAARGEVSVALALALALAEQAKEQGHLTFYALALHDVARLGQPRLVAASLREAAVEVEGQLAPLYAAHAAALVARDAAALDDVSSAFARIGVNLLAAETAVETARAYREAGRRSSALAAARKATRLAAVCEGARTPAFDLLTERPVLTSREQEIAGLAARGLTSRTIAERLVISVRTVDNALQQVYGKLGLTSRTELSDALNLSDPVPMSSPSEYPRERGKEDE